MLQNQNGALPAVRRQWEPSTGDKIIRFAVLLHEAGKDPSIHLC